MPTRCQFFFFFSSRRRHTRCSRDWSSDVCSSDLAGRRAFVAHGDGFTEQHWSAKVMHRVTRYPITIWSFRHLHPDIGFWIAAKLSGKLADTTKDPAVLDRAAEAQRSEEHTSELQSRLHLVCRLLLEKKKQKPG